MQHYSSNTLFALQVFLGPCGACFCVSGRGLPAQRLHVLERGRAHAAQRAGDQRRAGLRRQRGLLSHHGQLQLLPHVTHEICNCQ